MESNYATISELMSEWMKRHHQKGYEHFTYDGIVNEELYSSLPLRICYVLKECYLTVSEKQDDIRDSIAYHNDPDNYNVGSHRWVKYIRPEDGDYTYNLRKNILKEPNWYMWHRVEHLTKVMWQAFLSTDETDNIKTSRYNQRIAVVDLKKSNGTNQSNSNDISKYASEDSDLLTKEMELIGANVIFFGGTFDICKQAGLIDESELKDKVEFDKRFGRTGIRAAYSYRGKILIDAYHPTARGISYKKNDEATPGLKEIFERLK